MIRKLFGADTDTIRRITNTTISCIEESGKFKVKDRIFVPNKKNPALWDVIIEFYPVAWAYPEPIKKDEYVFRGETNIQKVILDCLKDNKVGFVVIEPGKAQFFFGVHNEILQLLPYPFESVGGVLLVSLHVTRRPIELLSRAIKFLKQAQKIWEELPEKLNKEICKSNRKMDKAGIKRETVKVKVF